VSRDLVRIGASIRDGSFFENRAFVEACDNAVRTGARFTWWA
jgi:bisphosphoglycerate-independent phosphoglycerate mutase (AlkP superfamily)